MSRFSDVDKMYVNETCEVSEGKKEKSKRKKPIDMEAALMKCRSDVLAMKSADSHCFTGMKARCDAYARDAGTLEGMRPDPKGVVWTCPCLSKNHVTKVICSGCGIVRSEDQVKDASAVLNNYSFLSVNISKTPDYNEIVRFVRPTEDDGEEYALHKASKSMRHGVRPWHAKGGSSACVEFKEVVRTMTSKAVDVREDEQVEQIQVRVKLEYQLQWMPRVEAFLIGPERVLSLSNRGFNDVKTITELRTWVKLNVDKQFAESRGMLDERKKTKLTDALLREQCIAWMHQRESAFYLKFIDFDLPGVSGKSVCSRQEGIEIPCMSITQVVPKRKGGDLRVIMGETEQVVVQIDPVVNGSCGDNRSVVIPWKKGIEGDIHRQCAPYADIITVRKKKKKKRNEHKVSTCPYHTYEENLFHKVVKDFVYEPMSEPLEEIGAKVVKVAPVKKKSRLKPYEKGMPIKDGYVVEGFSNDLFRKALVEFEYVPYVEPFQRNLEGFDLQSVLSQGEAVCDTVYDVVDTYFPDYSVT